MIKAIFSDLDNTLLSDDQTICEKNLEAIKKARENGVRFLFCTGRLPFCYKMYDYLGLEDYIAANGEIIIKDNKVIRIAYIEDEAKKRVLKYAMDHEEYLRIFAEDFLYLLNHEKAPNCNIYKESKYVDYKEAIEVIEKIGICKMSFAHKDHEHLKKIKEEIDSLHLNIDCAFSADTILECGVKGINKAEGIKYYLKELNIDIKDTLSMGDNMNDEEMLKVTGISASPRNGVEEIKKLCDYVSLYDNNEGAVGDIIDKYVLNCK